MDPTAPNNNNQNPGGAAPQSPIQPGQFVVAGDDQQAPQAPMSAPSAPQQPIQNPDPPQPAVSLAGARQETANPSVLPNAPVDSTSTQPDPTPFTPQGQAAGQPVESAQNKGGGGSKMIIIALAVLILVAIIGAVVYFFVLPKLKGSTQKAQSTTDTQIEAPSPPPPKTGSGFGDIPESSTGAQQPPQTTIPNSPTTLTPPATTNSNPVSP